MNKKPTAREAINSLIGQRGLTNTPQPAKEIKKIKKVDGRKNNGGLPGVGRKSLEKDEKRFSVKQSWEGFATEEIVVELGSIKDLHKGTKAERKVKMSRLRIAQEKLFENVLKNDTTAIKEFSDRVGGKARQPLVGDEEADPIRVDLGVDRLLGKAYGEDEDED